MLHVTLIQANLQWEDATANLAILQNKIENITTPTHLIILPEMFTTGYSMQPQLYAHTPQDDVQDWMLNLATEKKAVLCGSVMMHDNGKYYNRLLWVPPTGIVEQYDKRHLFTYANEQLHYTAGTAPLTTTLKGALIRCNICYDLRFPVWSRQPYGSMPYDVLLYVANWPHKRSRAWKTLLVARAIENQCYVIGVNRVGDDGNGIYHSGDSMVVDPLGEILYYKADDEAVATITLDIDMLHSIRAKFPFLKDGDAYQLL